MLKTTIIAVTMFFAAAILSHEQTSQPSPVGRFQLLQMRHEILDSQSHTTLTVDEIFRIDTATGRTVVYNEGVNAKGEYHSRWDGPIDEPK